MVGIGSDKKCEIAKMHQNVVSYLLSLGRKSENKMEFSMEVGGGVEFH